MGQKKVWERHEQVLESLDDSSEPSTRQPTPHATIASPSHPDITAALLAGRPSEFEEKRYKLAKSTNMLLRVFAGILTVSIVVGIVVSLFGDDMLSGDGTSKNADKGGDFGVLHPSNNKANFATLTGLSGVKNAIQQVLRPLPIPNLKPVRGLLMYGPPGCGKTEIAKAAAGQFGMSFISVSCASIMSPYVGRSAMNIRRVFSMARAHQPCIVLFDEVDTLIPNKDGAGGGDSGSQETSKAVSQWLIEMTNATNDVNSRIYIFAATNHPKKLDSATLRRFEKKVYVPLPNKEMRIAMLSRSFGHLKRNQLQSLADLTYGYSSSDLESIQKECYALMMDKYKDVNKFDGPLYPEFALVEGAVKSTPASSSEREIREFISWSKQFGGTVEREDPPANRRQRAGGVVLTAEQLDIADKLIVVDELDERFPKLQDIAGLDGIKSVLTSEIYSITQGGNGSTALLYGPAGTGKSTIAKAIAKYASEVSGDKSRPWKVLPINSQDIFSKYIGQSEKMVDAIFRVAESNQPCVIFLDEMDGLFQPTAEGASGDGSATNNRIKTAFQTIVGDLIENPAEILLIGTTNKPEVFDDAMRRRFRHMLYVPLPGKEARKQIFRRLLNTDDYQFSDKALDTLADSTSSWSGADISAAVATARTHMLITVAHEESEAKAKGVKEYKKWNPKHIRQDVLAHVIRNHVPTNSMDTIKTLHGWQYGKKMDIEEDDVMAKIFNFFERMFKG